MEKRKPHANLNAVKDLVKAGKVRTTFSALSGAATLGLGFEEMHEIIMSLTSTDFYKSMTTSADHRVWQDVYRPQTQVGNVYLKLTVSDDVLIVTFKEL